jgi:glutathione S-transferase
MNEEMVLYGESNWESPYVFSCFVALREKGLPFEMKTWTLAAGEHRRGDYANRSVTGRVPALAHGDFWLAESSAIDEYLEDLFPPPQYPRLYPAGVRERARARQVQAWLRSDLLPLREERPTTTVFGARADKPLSSTAQWAAERLLGGCEQLLAADAPYLFGESFGIADADLALMLQRLVKNGDPVPEQIRAYAERIWARPSVREFAEHPRQRAV